jgi:hypothetical protein
VSAGTHLRGIGQDVFLELVEANGPLLDELSVVEFLTNDDVEHSQGQRQVGAGARLDPHVRSFCRFRLPGVDDD